jgi:Holliday junction resolvasome RuvABC endonuclease subunit
VQKVVQAILGLAELPGEDEADALAIAVCHLNAPRIPGAPAGSGR